MASNYQTTSKSIAVYEHELPIACPPPNAPHWQLHPKVFLQINKQNTNVHCPYCGMHFHLKDNK